MSSIPNETLNKLRIVLLKCDAFESDRSLLSVFSNYELRPFRSSIPSASNISNRVDWFLDFIIEKKLSDGKYLLPIFIATLRERYPPEDAQHFELDMLYDEVYEDMQNYAQMNSVMSGKSPITITPNHLEVILRKWFQSLSYVFEDYQRRTRDHFDWIINLPTQIGYDRILVRGITNEVKVSHIIALRDSVNQLKTHRGWLVTVRRKSQAACSEIEKKENHNLFCFTFDELLDEYINIEKYKQWLENEVQRQDILSLYIPQACSQNEYDSVTMKIIGKNLYNKDNGWLDGYIDRWLDDPSKEQVSILGEFGTGKTWFALHYSWTAMLRYQEAVKKGLDRPRLALYIPLRDYIYANNIETLFSDFLFRKHEIRIPNYIVFEQLNRMGRLLLIMDGFDEMAGQMDQIKLVRHFWELARIVVPGSKVILTSRTSFFRYSREADEVFKGERRGQSMVDLSNKPEFDVVNLEFFDEIQIQKYLRKKLGAEKGKEAFTRLSQIYDLSDLAHRPILLDMICSTISEIPPESQVNVADIYRLYIEQWIRKSINEGRTFISYDEKRSLMNEVAWQMYCKNTFSIYYSNLVEYLGKIQGNELTHDKEPRDFDFRTQSLFERDQDGNYRFAHNSFKEFLVAEKIIEKLIKSSDVGLDVLPDREVSFFVRHMLDENDIKKLIQLIGNDSPITSRASEIWAAHLIVMTLEDFEHSELVEDLTIALGRLKMRSDVVENIWTIEEIVRTLGRLDYKDIVLQHLEFMNENKEAWIRTYENLISYFNDEVGLVEGLIRHLHSDSYSQANKVMEVFRLGELPKLITDQKALSLILSALPEMRQVLASEDTEKGRKICEEAIAGVLAI